jgi:hypothetical protein
LPGEESMNAITVNTFPGVNSFTSARSWVLALIVLLHVGFFWALSNGLSIGSFVEMPRRTVIDNLPVPSKPTPPARVIDDVPIRHAYTPRPAQPRPQFEEEKGTSIEQVVDAPPLVERGSAVAPAPVVVEPEVDPRSIRRRKSGWDTPAPSCSWSKCFRTDELEKCAFTSRAASPGSTIPRFARLVAGDCALVRATACLRRCGRRYR